MSSPVWTVLRGDGGALECWPGRGVYGRGGIRKQLYGIASVALIATGKTMPWRAQHKSKCQNESRSLKSEEAQPSTKHCE